MMTITTMPVRQRNVTTRLFAVSLIAGLVLCQPSQASETAMLQQKQQPMSRSQQAQQNIDQLETIANDRKVRTQPASENSAEKVIAWQGPWHFEKKWFDKQHPWLPRYVKNIALKSTLVVDQEFYHQVDDKGKALKEKRKLMVKSVTTDRAVLSRIEGRKEIEFSIELRDDGFYYYCEGRSVYRIHPPLHDLPKMEEYLPENSPVSSVEGENSDHHDGMVIETERWEPEF